MPLAEALNLTHEACPHSLEVQSSSSKPQLGTQSKVLLLEAALTYWVDSALQLWWYSLAGMCKSNAAFAEAFAAGQKLNYHSLWTLYRNHASSGTLLVALGPWW